MGWLTITYNPAISPNIKVPEDMKKKTPNIYFDKNELQFVNAGWGLMLQKGNWRITWLKDEKFSIQCLRILDKQSVPGKPMKKHWTDYLPFFKKQV